MCEQHGQFLIPYFTLFEVFIHFVLLVHTVTHSRLSALTKRFLCDVCSVSSLRPSSLVIFSHILQLPSIIFHLSFLI